MSGTRPGLLFAAGLVALLLLGAGAGPVRPGQCRAAPPAPPAMSASSRAGQAPLTLRFAMLERISGEDPQLPASLLARYRGATLQLSYQVCVRSDGRVMMISRRSGIADADPSILPTLRAWRYPPQPANTMTCVHEVFEFSQ